MSEKQMRHGLLFSHSHFAWHYCAAVACRRVCCDAVTLSETRQTATPAMRANVVVSELCFGLAAIVPAHHYRSSVANAPLLRCSATKWV